MAQGSSLAVLTPSDAIGILGSQAELQHRNDHPVREFDDAGQDSLYFEFYLPKQFGANAIGIDIELIWSSRVASGNVRWGTSIERMDDTGTDIDADAFAAEITADVAVNATSGKLSYTTRPHTLGAQMDSAVRGEWVRLRIRRLGTHANDTAAGGALLHTVIIKETAGSLGESAQAGYDFGRRTFKDEFDRDFPAAATALDVNGTQHWTKLETAGLGVIAASDGPGLVFELDSSTEIAVAQLLGAKIWDIDNSPILEFVLESNENGDDAALDFDFGFADATEGSMSQFLLFHLNGADLSVFCRSNDGSTEVTEIDTNVDLVDEAKTAFRIDCSDKTDVKFYINGTQVLSGTTFTMADYSGLLSIIFNVSKTSNDTIGKFTLRRVMLDIAA